MTVYEAIRASKSGIAKGKNQRTGKIELAKNTGAGIRIISSFTDCTVVKKLTPSHWAYKGWEPA